MKKILLLCFNLFMNNAIAQNNFFDDYTIKKNESNEFDVEKEFLEGVDFSAEEMADLRSFQVSLPPGYLSVLDIFPKQIENLKTTSKQRNSVEFTMNQYSVMDLTPEQFDAMELTEEQLGSLRLSQFEDPNSSPIKLKLSTKPKELNSQELFELKLSGEQFFQLKLTDEQKVNLEISEEQLSRLQSFAETELSFEQFEQLGIEQKQMRGLVLNITQLKKLQLIRFKEFQPLLTSSQLEELSLNPEQVIQLDLTVEQIENIKLLPAQVTALGLEFIKSNAQSLYLEKLSTLQNSKTKLKSYQFRQMSLESWQLQNIQFDQRQINTLRRIFRSNIAKKKYLALIDKLYPIQIAQIGLSLDQIQKLKFNNNQIKSLKLTEFQLDRVGATDEELDKYVQGEILDSLIAKMKINLYKADLTEQQLSEIEYTPEQFENVSFTEPQLEKIRKFYNVNIIRSRLLEYLRFAKGKDAEVANFGEVQLSDIKLKPLQLALVDFDQYQLRKVGVSRSEYQTFQNQILKSNKRYSIGNIEQKLNKMKLPPEVILDFYQENGYKITKYPQVDNFVAVPYDEEQIKELGISKSEYLLAKSGSINTLLSQKLKYNLEKVELSPQQLLEFNYRIRKIPSKKLKAREVAGLDLDSNYLEQVNLNSDELSFYQEFLKVQRQGSFSNVEVDARVLQSLRSIVPRSEQIVKIELTPNQLAALELNKNQVVLVHYLSQNELLELEGDELEIYRLAKEAEEKISLREGDKKTFEYKTRFANQNRSVINWETISPEEFLDLNSWKLQREEREQHPFWKNILREQVNIESFGRVIDCIGKCVIYRGTDWHTLNSRSEVFEKDELYTGADGHAWIELIDGTTIRVSPNTSLIFNEVNLGRSRVMYYLNLNWGNIVWQSREKEFFSRKPQKETDQLFLPSPIVEANFESDPTIDLFSVNSKQRQIEKLNNSIESNNSILKSVYSTVILSFQNGYLYGDNPNFEVLSLLGNTNYLYSSKRHDEDYWNSALEFKLHPLTVFYENSDKGDELSNDQWYELGLKDNQLTSNPETETPLYFNQYIVTHIPTIKLVREIFFERYFAEIFSPQTSTEVLAEKFGYREWERETFNKKDDLTARIEYLSRYVFRERQYHKALLDTYAERFQKIGKKSVIHQKLNNRFYAKSMEAMIRDTEKSENAEADRIILNSTKKPFWEIIKKYNFRQGKGLIFKN